MVTAPSSLLGRRELLRRAGALGAVLAAAPLLAACGDREALKRLSFLNWQDYIDPATLEDFERRTGITVTYETYESNDDLEKRLVQAARVRRGGREAKTFDLIVPSDNFVTRFRRDSMLQELDRDRLEHLGNLRDELRRAPFDPGNRYTVPWATGTTGIGYDTTVFDEPPGYEVFLDPTYKGKVTILDERRDAFAAALFSLDLDPNTTDPDDIDAAAEQLRAMKDVVRGFDSSAYLDDLADGKLVAAHAYSSDVLQARERNDKLAFTLPEAGALRWVDSLAVPDGAPRPEQAHTFIDYFLEPEVSAQVSAYVKVDTGNAAATEFLPAEILDDPVIHPPADVLDRLVFTKDLGDDEDLYSEAWDEIRG